MYAVSDLKEPNLLTPFSTSAYNEGKGGVNMTDKNKYNYKGCSAIMGTLTNAQKAQKALSAAAIPTSLGKDEALSSNRGCIWSVNFSCNQLENVRAVLLASGISVKKWGRGDDIL